ncbi:hypothetical protein O6H91_14G030400 [Diphasiastrum complanatum]|uniref:Uncharacterized protein n=1 Tax=Diphasiastrum complanatum TaxID=34168 RepID=A0ACC2BMR2_DIPCM|nr:hypothetical protein O6H91_14G030400 [Diphasiastrum complanatum]
MACAKKLIPLLDRVLVEKIVAPAKSVGGILLPESAAASQVNAGKVVAVGTGGRAKDGTNIPILVNEGDTVLLPEYGGTPVKLGEKEYVLFRDDDLLGILHD